MTNLAGSSDGGFFVLGETNSGELWVAKIGSKSRILWQRAYGNLNNYTVSPVTTYKGGLVIAGSASNRGWLALISPNGNVIWPRTYGVSGGCDIASAGVTPEGDIVAAGWIKENKRSNAWLIRVDGNGNVVWSRSYHENGSSKLTAVTVESNGDILAGGGVIYK